jgi:hypothetical protein
VQGAREAISRAISTARANGGTVALTTGDPGLVARHREEFWGQIHAGYVDVLFANRWGTDQLSLHVLSYIVLMLKPTGRGEPQVHIAQIQTSTTIPNTAAARPVWRLV